MEPGRVRGDAAAFRANAPRLFVLDERIAVSAVVLIAVPDRAVAETAAAGAALNADLRHQVWLHTAGALGASALAPVARCAAGVGGFHPARAFPPGRVSKMPPGTIFGVDGNDAALRTAAALAEALGGRVVRVPEEIRSLYHAMCVMASNALIGLLADATRTLASAGIDEADAERLLVTLAGGAVFEAASNGLEAALTGPVQRGDAATVSRHLDALCSHRATAALYRAAARAILRAARSQGNTDVAALAKIEDIIDAD